MAGLPAGSGRSKARRTVPPGDLIEWNTRHPVLGPAVVVNDDRRATSGRLVLELGMVPLGVFGIFLGMGDLNAGNTLIGVGQIAGAVIVALYGVRGSILDFRRRSNPARLAIARDGFEFVPGRSSRSRLEMYPAQRPISWSDVESVSDPRAPRGLTRSVRVQLADPSGFANREAFSLFARAMMRFNRGDLVLGGGMSLQPDRVEAMMQKQLAEFKSGGTQLVNAPAQPPARKPNPSRRRRGKR